MSKERMTIHRALAELKLIDSRIEKQISNFIPVSINQKNKLIAGHIKAEDFTTDVQSGYDSILSLIARKSKIKTSVVEANTRFLVKVGGVSMSIADAITNKANIEVKKIFLDKLVNNLESAVAAMNKNNDVTEKNAQILLENAFGRDNAKINPSDIESVQKPYLENNMFHLVNPLKIEDKIKQLGEEIENFETEVDAVLSEANAINFIEF